MNEQIISLLHKSINGVTLSEVDKNELDAWIERSEHNRELYNEIMNSEEFRQDIKEMLRYDGKPIWNKISKELYPSQYKSNAPVYRKPFFKWAAAAALLVCISTTVYFLFVKPSRPQQNAISENPTPVVNDLAPGKEKASLILDDGSVVALDNSTSNGKLAEQGNAIVVKDDGLLAYNTVSKIQTAKVFYNTIKTVKGEYYSSLVLADGSKVWLNSLSTIRFPTSFQTNERAVEVTGEAYFEIAKNAAKPFRVNVKDRGMSVIVTGTHFNVNAFADEEAIRTTLLEGSVKIVSKDKTSLLKPGEQASVNKNGEIKVTNADVEEAIAWKSGMFIFKKDDIETIMREISRWYDVDVIFEDKIPGHFVATLPRSVPVSKLLKILEMAGGVRFEIDESKKKIIVRH